MTIKEALISSLGGIKASSVLIERSMLQADISDSSVNYSPALHDDMIEIALMNTLFGIWGTFKSVSEGDMSVSFSDDMSKKLLFLAKKHGRKDIVDLLDDKPKIKAIRRW